MTKLPGEVYTESEMRSLLAQCSRRAPTGIRDRALLTMIYRAGLRISEALDLKPSDVDMKTGTITIRHGKGDKARKVGLGDGALAVLQLWLDCRRNLGLSGHLFCTLKGTRMSYTAADNMLKRRATKAGIEKRAHLHGLRHTHAFEMHHVRKVPVAVIQQALGHEHLSTTTIYLNHLAPEDVIAAGRADIWVDA
jgi:site-specific recombinase XerD